jgi:hypothetical protein
MKCSSSLTLPQHLLCSDSPRERNRRFNIWVEQILLSLVLLRKIKLTQTFCPASFHQVLCNHFHRILYVFLRVKVSVVYQTVQSFSTKDSFYLTKATFDRIELWRITNVFDLHDVKLLVALDDFFRFVNTELVHEDS